ncbi:hypothetical protein V6N11_031727 [Hibiscus sabdariffa]|uniref:Uncharacterized protein n=1 Tax=Hibiscus sabdariffa TaxID=183260 RepID=A0ABR2SYQ5_9ROSI
MNLTVQSDDCTVQRNLHKRRWVFGGIDENKVVVLSTCVIGWCKNLISIVDLEFQMSQVQEVELVQTLAVECHSEGEVSSCDSDSKTSSVYRDRGNDLKEDQKCQNEFVAFLVSKEFTIVSELQGGHLIGMELTLCANKVTQCEGMTRETMNVGLVTEVGWRL